MISDPARWQLAVWLMEGRTVQVVCVGKEEVPVLRGDEALAQLDRLLRTGRNPGFRVQTEEEVTMRPEDGDNVTGWKSVDQIKKDHGR